MIEKNNSAPSPVSEASPGQISLPSTAVLPSDTQSKNERPAGNMSLIEHLEELRKRIIYSLIATAISSGICYYYVEDIMHYLLLPVGKLYYMQPSEAFFTYLKIAIFAGFLLALPFILYQIWRFVLPALTITEKKVLVLVVPASLLLFIGGLAFSFFLVLPAAIKFFIGFGSADLLPMFSLTRYFSFVMSFILPFGVVFEMPLVAIILAKIGLITSKLLIKKWRLVIFLSFVIAAIVTPTPDVFTQTMIALPMILLYFSSYLIIRFILKK